ncbi:unnamed protein product [Brassica rapa subsp. trilocularis]
MSGRPRHQTNNRYFELAMKPGGSGLNPNAAAYVPIAKRDGDSAKPAASEKQMSDEDLEMDVDIEFLLATFSDLSYESISDVYLANNGDLDATIEMLTQLEIFSNEAEEYLPDTLDIGDVPETIEPSTSSAPKQTNASASTSSRAPNAPSS